MPLHTTIETKKAKICLFSYKNDRHGEKGDELYLSEVKGKEQTPDHTIIQRFYKADGILYYHINGREVEQRIVDEIIKFLRG